MKFLYFTVLALFLCPVLMTGADSTFDRATAQRGDKLPTNWSWTNVNGKNYITTVRNHHYPQYCGGCYAFGSTTTFTDRIKIMRDAAFPDIIISPQVILSCSNAHGCHGGSPTAAYEYIKQYGISDETCSPYIAKGHENGAPCTAERKCSVCDADGNCKVPDSYPVYFVEEFGHIVGEQAMMEELVHGGPIACMLDSGSIWNYTGGILSIYMDKYDFDHVAEVVGYGIDEEGTPYWLMKNSWGSFWGENGFARIHRGNNSLGLESSCFWVIPKDTWTNDVRNYTNAVTTSNSEEEESAPNGFLANIVGSKESCLKFDSKYDDFTSLSGELPFASIPTEELPTSLDYRNFNGINFASWTRSQNAPAFCASCWAEATTSALADRVMIARNSTFPQIGLAAQTVINCQAGGGDCSGGDPLAAYDFAYTNGIPDDSCQGYLARDPQNPVCSGFEVCGYCVPPAPKFAWSVNPNNCTGAANFTSWKVSDYGRVNGLENMKKAIYSDGPIACSISVTTQLEQYTGGIFSQAVSGSQTPNHEVSIVGWDVSADGTEYWIVRNSWGSYWGEMGYFRIQTGSNNLGIEDNCVWAIPIVDTANENMINSDTDSDSDVNTIDI